MSALREALPLALSAAIYPPALLVLLLLMTGRDPRGLVLAYFCGAALVTVGTGLIALEVLSGASLTTHDSPTASGAVDIVLGLALVAFAAWARRKSTTRREPARPAGRIAEWSRRATASRRWALVLGLAMFLPSPLYLLAVKDIADSDDGRASQVLAVLVCAIGVMLFVEVPLVAMFVAPGRVGAGLEHAHGWLSRNGWTLAAALALIAGVYAIVKGIGELA